MVVKLICLFIGYIVGILSTNLFAKSIAKKYTEKELKRIKESLEAWEKKVASQQALIEQLKKQQGKEKGE